MDAKELRIGNILNWNNEKGLATPYIIEQINELKYHDCFVPIELTEEWLLKFGFGEKCKSAGNRWQFFNGKDWFELYDFYDEEEKLTGKFFYSFKFEIKYVHQLQNLYFALTGTELLFKNNNNES
jgi:hypothetical protein